MAAHRIILSLAAAISGSIAFQSAVSAQEYRGTAEQQMACTPDVFRLCGAEIPDTHRIVGCLRQNIALLSRPCRAVFESSAGNSQQAAPQQPAQQDPRAAERAARDTADKVAQLAALEREELDELSSDAKAVNVRVAALQKLQEAQGQQPRSDIAASQERMQRDITLAESALRKADVQNAQNYMDQANAELAKLKKFLGQ